MIGPRRISVGIISLLLAGAGPLTAHSPLLALVPECSAEEEEALCVHGRVSCPRAPCPPRSLLGEVMYLTRRDLRERWRDARMPET